MIISDLDGTLLNNDEDCIKREFVNKIRAFTDRGVIFAVNSGRSYVSLKNVLKEIENRTVFICNDGTQIMYKNCLLYKMGIDKSILSGIKDKCADLNIDFTLCLRDKNISGTENGFIFEDVYKIILDKSVCGVKKISKIKEFIKNLNVRICFEDNKFLEICNKSADKGKAAEYIKKRFGIENGVVAFGDGENDLPMFDNADTVYIVKSKNNIGYGAAKVISGAQQFIIDM